MKRVILELGGKSVQLYLPDAVADGPAKAVRRRDGRLLRACGPGLLVADADAGSARAGRGGRGRGVRGRGGPDHRATRVIRRPWSARSSPRRHGTASSGSSPRGSAPAVAWPAAAADRPASTAATLPAHARRGGGQREPARAARDLRAGRHRAGLPRPRRGDRDHQRLRVRPLRGHLRARPHAGDRDRRAHPHRDGPGEHGRRNAYTPMGGHKHSGIGRERGVPGIRAFQQVKHVVIGNG